MITTRKYLVLGAATIGTVLACASDYTAPTAPAAPRVFTSLEMSPSTLLVAPIPGLNSGWLEVHARDQHGVTMAGRGEWFSLSSSGPGVATVTDVTFWTRNAGSDAPWVSASVNAVAAGEAVISASLTIGGVTKTATATVEVSLEEWSVKVDPAVLTLHVGSRKRIHAAVLDRTGKPRVLSAGDIAFTSDRDDVVALHEDAWCEPWGCEPHINVLGVAPGETIITARIGGLSATVNLIVVPEQSDQSPRTGSHWDTRHKTRRSR